jgi:hypothetical protein
MERRKVQLLFFGALEPQKVEGQPRGRPSTHEIVFKRPVHVELVRVVRGKTSVYTQFKECGVSQVAYLPGQAHRQIVNILQGHREPEADAGPVRDPVQGGAAGGEEPQPGHDVHPVPERVHKSVGRARLVLADHPLRLRTSGRRRGPAPAPPGGRAGPAAHSPHPLLPNVGFDSRNRICMCLFLERLTQIPDSPLAALQPLAERVPHAEPGGHGPRHLRAARARAAERVGPGAAGLPERGAAAGAAGAAAGADPALPAAVFGQQGAALTRWTSSG